MVVRLEIMVPLVGFNAELQDQVAIVHRVARQVLAKAGVKISYRVAP